MGCPPDVMTWPVGHSADMDSMLLSKYLYFTQNVGFCSSSTKQEKTDRQEKVVLPGKERSLTGLNKQESA